MKRVEENQGFWHLREAVKTKKLGRWRKKYMATRPVEHYRWSVKGWSRKELE